jgi:hypothetical protein
VLETIKKRPDEREGGQNGDDKGQHRAVSAFYSHDGGFKAEGRPRAGTVGISRAGILVGLRQNAGTLEEQPVVCLRVTAYQPGETVIKIV